MIEVRTVHRAQGTFRYLVIRASDRRRRIARAMHRAGRPLPLIARVCRIPAARLAALLRAQSIFSSSFGGLQ